MPYITKEEYKLLTGEDAPEDFEQLLTVAEATVDAHTLYGFVGRDISALHDYVVQKLKQSVAWQVQYVHHLGGIAGVNSSDYGSVGLGQFNYSVGSSRQSSTAAASVLPLSESAAVNIPFLVAVVRGLRE